MLDGLPVVVASAGGSAAAAARALRDRGARVTVLEPDGAPPGGTALVVVSRGCRPDAPLLLSSAAAGIEVVGEAELAWRLRAPGAPAWLAVAGAHGKTTTVRMLVAILAAAGHRTVAAGAPGLPLLDAVLGGEPYDVLAVELATAELHGADALAPHSAVLLNAGPAQAPPGRVHGPGTRAVYNREDAASVQLAAAADARAGFTLGSPAAGELGVVEDLIVDRAFPEVAGEATLVATLDDVRLPGDHNVANALAAAALARSYGVPAEAVAAGLRAVEPEAPGEALVAQTGGVSWVDASRARTPHAAAGSLAAHRRVVWIAGGVLTGAGLEGLVAAAASRLRGVVLLGADRAAFVEALRRHAAEIPVVEVPRLDTGAMLDAVTAARALARPGDTVLLAPAAASGDCFRDDQERGELFARAVQGTS